MKFPIKLLVLSLVMAGGVALAEGASDPDVKARQELMDANGAATKVLGNMASGKTAFDATAAAAARQKLIDGAAEIPAKFKNNATDPKSDAKADIWTSWDDFTAKAGDLGTAATAMDATSLDGVKSGMKAIGGACGACHKAYKS